MTAVNRNRLTKMQKGTFLAVSCAALMGLASASQASVIDATAQCSAGTAQYGVDISNVSHNTPGITFANDCFGAFSGNNDQSLTWNNMTWLEADRWDTDLGASDNDLLDVNLLTKSIGEWSFSGDTSGWESFFIVTKAANDPGWAAYFFEVGQAATFSGLFTIPWTNASGKPPGLSHLAIFAKTSTVTVDEPAALGLFGLGLLGLGLSLRRGRK